MSGSADSRAVVRVEPPSREEVTQYVEELNLHASDGEIDEWSIGARAIIGDLAWLDGLKNPGVTLRHPRRRAGRRPAESEDPYNAVISFCEVKGSEAGPLAGKRIGVKDTIPVAGVAMTKGVPQKRAPVPTEDAVVVERLLDAGAAVTAKTNVDGWPHPPGFGDTQNPHNPEFSPGFSSAGSAAAVSAGIVEAALGTDGAGSVRIPAAWCGLVGLKATNGLIPSSYGLGADSSIGPMTTTVADNAVMLEVIAGDDWRQLRACTGSHSFDGVFAGAAAGDLHGIRVGVIAESLESSGCTDKTLSAFEGARKVLVGLGADVGSVSVPLWTDAANIFWATSSFFQVASASSLNNNIGYRGRIDESLLSSETSKAAKAREGMLLLVEEHLRRRHVETSLLFAKAQNLRAELRRQVDVLLADVDLLLTPTTPTGPFRLADRQLAEGGNVQALIEPAIRNTVPLNLTGHPALTMPSGPGDHGLPTGLQIIGGSFDEHAIYRVAFAFEASSPDGN